MRIANVMFSRGLGGIEQAFLDYNDALLLAGHDVLAVTHPVAEINTHIRGELEHFTLSNLGSWDPLAALRLSKEYTRWQPDIIISHGNRAIQLNYRTKHAAYHIAVTHNYHLQHMQKVNGIFAITAELKETALQKTHSSAPVEIIPNMMTLPEILPQSQGKVPVIGCLGRMIPKKGFHLLIEAVTELHRKGYDFRLILGGDGEDRPQLEQQVERNGLNEKVTFSGWVKDKQSFFEEIDIFCLPSTHEPFGIVLLEAMAFGRPVVSFATEGPRDIIRHQEALLARPGDASDLALNLEKLISDMALQATLREKGRHLVETKYALPIVSAKIDAVLKQWTHT